MITPREALRAMFDWARAVLERGDPAPVELFVALLTWAWGAWFLGPGPAFARPSALAVMAAPFPSTWSPDAVDTAWGLFLVILAPSIVAAATSGRKAWRARTMLVAAWFWGAVLIALTNAHGLGGPAITFGMVVVVSAWAWARHSVLSR